MHNDSHRDLNTHMNIMKLFETYKLWDIEPVRGVDTTLWDKDGAEYTDLYGGHAVISVGHCHPHYVKMLSDQ